jgi:hypothetical protein
LLVFFLSLFFENIVLIMARMELPALYPVVFAFKFVVFLLAIGPRLLRMPVAFYLGAWPFVVLLGYGLVISDQSPLQMATSIRDVLFFVVVYYIVASLRLSGRRKIFDSFMFVTLYMALLNIVYSTYVQLGYDGDRRIFYFYEFVVSVGKWADFNYFRNGIVRACGLFVSPITFSNFMILPLSYALARLTTRFSLFNLTLTTVLMVGLAQTQTRNPYIALFIALGILVIWSLVRRFWVVVAAHGLAALGSFGGLALLYRFNLLDPSAAGRVSQTNELFRVILQDWRGVGFGSFGPQFAQATDLSVITVLLTFGFILAVLYYWCLFRVIYQFCATYQWQVLSGDAHVADTVRFRTVFLLSNAVVVTALNSNVFDGVVLTMFALILGLYPLRRHLLAPNDASMAAVAKTSTMSSRSVATSTPT